MTDVEMDDMETDALGQAFLESRAEEFGLFAAAWKAGREYGEDNLALVVSGCGQAENRVFEVEDKLATVEAAEKDAEDRAEAAETELKRVRDELAASTHLEMHTEDRRLGAEDRAELAEQQWGRAGRLLIQILAWLDDDTGASLDGEIVERVRGLVEQNVDTTSGDVDDSFRA